MEARKKARRTSVSRLLGVTNQAALVEVLRQVRDLPDESLNLRRVEFQAYHRELLESLGHEITLELDDGSEFKWQLLHPGKFLAKLVQKESLGNLFRDALRRHPVSKDRPWSIVIGFDEFVPGSKLNLLNHRKCMVLSFSFLELGEGLRHESAWFSPVVVRSEIMHRVQGGWPHMFVLFVRVLLLDPEGLMTGGVALEVGGQSVLLFATVRNVLSDGDGLRLVSDWRGANAIKPCWRHCNVAAKRDEAFCSDGFVDITCTDHTQMRTAKAGYIEHLMDMLVAAEDECEAGAMTLDKFKAIGRASGFNANRKGLLADKEMRKIVRFGETGTFDWVHTMLQSGVVTVELFLFTSECERLAICSFQDLEQFLKHGWDFPAAARMKGRQLWRIFDDHRDKSSHKNERLKLSASELLGVYGLFRHFVETKIGNRPELARQRDSLDKCMVIVDLLLDAKRGVVNLRSVAPVLRQQIAAFMEAHIAIYGKTHVLPKHHWMFDIAEQLLRDTIVLDAFVIERAHLRVKKVAEPIKNTRMFEKSVLAACAIAHAKELDHPDALTNGLRGLQKSLPDAPDVTIADHLSINNLHIAVGDFVVADEVVCLVAACLCEDRELFVLLRPTRRARTLSSSAAMWRFVDGAPQHFLRAANSVEQVNAWYDVGDDVVVLRK